MVSPTWLDNYFAPPTITTTADYVQPAVNSTVSVSVDATEGLFAGEFLFIQDAGGYVVMSIADETTMVVKNLGGTGSASPSSTIPGGKGVQLAGPAGAQGTSLSPFVSPTAPPNASAFTFDTTTAGGDSTKTTASDGVLQISSPSVGTGNSRSIATVALGAAPYSRRVGILASMQAVTDLMFMGICISDGTKAIGFAIDGAVGTDSKVVLNHYTDLVTPGSAIVNKSVGTLFSFGAPLFFGIDEAGGNRSYLLSNSGREGSYQQIYTEAVSFLTPTKFGLMWQGFATDPATRVKFDVFHWGVIT